MGILTMYAGIEDHINGTVGELEGGGEGTTVAVSEVAIEEVKAELAESIAEVEQLEAAVTEVKEELLEHEETVEELQEEITGMEALLSSGQFSGLGFAQKYNRALRLNAKLGGSNFSTLGAESISDAATARLASVSGVETFMETVKSGASKAIEFIKHVFNTVINFFVGLFSTASALQRRQKQLEEALNKKQVKETIKLGSWNIGCDYEAEGIKGIDKMVGSSAFGITHESLPKFIDLGKKLDGIDAAAFKTAYKGLIDDIKAVAKDAGKVSEKSDSSDKRTVLGTHAGFRIFASFEDKYETEEQMISAARSVKISFGKTEEAKKFASGKEVKTKALNSDLKSLLGSVTAYVEEIRGSKTQQKFSKAQRDQVIGMLNVASKTHEGLKEKNGKAVALCKAIYISSSSLATQLTKLYAYIAKQTMDVVQAHI